MLINPWQTLDVLPGESQKELKKKYKAKVLCYHPDTYRQYHPDMEEEAARKHLNHINMSFKWLQENLIDGKVPPPRPQRRPQPIHFYHPYASPISFYTSPIMSSTTTGTGASEGFGVTSWVITFSF